MNEVKVRESIMRKVRVRGVKVRKDRMIEVALRIFSLNRIHLVNSWRGIIQIVLQLITRVLALLNPRNPVTQTNLLNPLSPSNSINLLIQADQMNHPSPLFPQIMLKVLTLINQVENQRPYPPSLLSLNVLQQSEKNLQLNEVE